MSEFDPLTSSEQDAHGFGLSDGFGVNQGFGASEMTDVGMDSEEEISSSDKAVELPEETVVAPPPKTTACCEFDKVLSSLDYSYFLPNSSIEKGLPNAAISIPEAAKCFETSGTSFIAYAIHTEIQHLGIHFEARRRYSEFEGLRKLMTRMYPYAIVPPIPEKHSVKDYASKPGKAKENPEIIDKRKRMLESFLNRVAAHPTLSGLHVFHQFLKGEGSWSDILAMSGLGFHLKKKNPAKVGERTTIKNPDPQTIKQEDYTNRFSAQITFIRKHFKTVAQNMDEVVTVTSDLGTLYNGWSLNEDKLAKTIEYVGQAIDLTSEATKALSISNQASLGKLLKQYEQYSLVIDKVLKARRKKYVEFETLSESLINKQTTLGKLESSEHESQRISAVINSEGVSGGYVPPAGVQRSSGILATINSLIDNDPESSRRRNISKTKDRITSIEEQKEALNSELTAAAEIINKELEVFQRQKIRDARNAFLAFAIGQRDYHQKALSAWKEARSIIDKESV